MSRIRPWRRPWGSMSPAAALLRLRSGTVWFGAVSNRAGAFPAGKLHLSITRRRVASWLGLLYFQALSFKAEGGTWHEVNEHKWGWGVLAPAGSLCASSSGAGSGGSSPPATPLTKRLVGLQDGEEGKQTNETDEMSLIPPNFQSKAVQRAQVRVRYVVGSARA